jgi:hypothetical protein
VSVLSCRNSTKWHTWKGAVEFIRETDRLGERASKDVKGSGSRKDIKGLGSRMALERGVEAFDFSNQFDSSEARA